MNDGSVYLAHGDFVYRHTPVPVFSQAQGPFLKDVQGRMYFDAEAANGTASLGFDATILTEAVAMDREIPGIPSFLETEIRLQVAKKLGDLFTEVLQVPGRIAFELGGAQGVELALKIAKANTKKSQWVVFGGGYHGRSIYTSQFSASHRYRSLMGEWRVPVTRLPYPDKEQYDSDPALWEPMILSFIKQLVSCEAQGLVTQKGDPDIAALIIEPVQNAGGIVKPSKKFMETVVSLFQEREALIIVDEVFCGFYRTGPFLGLQHYDFTPDIVITSKAITNGITPLSCVWAKNPLLDDEHFPPGTHSATYINTPFALSVASVVLDRYAKWHTREKDIHTFESVLQSTLDEIVATTRIAKSGYALGGLGRILLTKNYAAKIIDIARTIAMNHPIDNMHGLILASTGMAPNVVAINPPLILTGDEQQMLRSLLLATFKEADAQLA